MGEKKALSGFGTELGTQVSGGGSFGRGTKDRSHRAEESQCYPENTGEAAGEEGGPIWGLMLEKMPSLLHRLGADHQPSGARGPRSGSSCLARWGGCSCGLLAVGWETTLLICKASLGALPACLLWLGCGR